ncbi:MAG: hypothetical protein ACP5NW_00790 [Candidatus Woesearchaeota archaeon]
MRNTYILLIIQAMLTLLLFFSEGYVKYITIGFFILFNLILFIDLLTKKWSYVEVLTFAAIFCSGLFLMFYMYMKSSITMIFGISVMLLFLVVAMLSIQSRVDGKKEFDLKMPESPEQHYDADYYPHYATVQPDFQPKKPEPVMHVQHEEVSPVKSKLAAKAVAYELEKEANELKNAEKLIKEMKIYNAEKELLKESKDLEAAQKQIDALKNTQKAAKAAKELKKEAREIMKVQKQINDINKIQQLEKEAQSLKKAEKQIKEIKFLDQQEKIVKQAKAIAKAQKDIDTLKSKKVSVPAATKAKVVKIKDESFYFSTETGNKFHEPGCIAIKKVPKNKLTLFTSKKEALKKGLQPCSVCIPK